MKLCQQHAARLFGQARPYEPRIRDLGVLIVMRKDEAAETVRARGEISHHDEFFCMVDGDLDPVRAAIAGPIEAPFSFHDDPFETHRGAGLHQAPALRGGKRLRQLHGIARERRPELLQNAPAFLERPAEQRVAVYIHAVEEHITDMTW